MQFFSGFSLKNEEYFFDSFIKKDDFTLCGFSYGAIKAFEATLQMREEGKRIDTLQLFSPAFFQSKGSKFHRLQLMAYRKNKKAYIEQFLDACFAPIERQKVDHYETDISELKELLKYEWSLAKLYELKNSGVAIEVYLGAKDNIVDASAAQDFFKEIATVTYIQKANHFLQIA